MKAQASIQIGFDSEVKSKMIFKALKPETRIPASDRSKVKSELDGNDVLLSFRAADVAALRASINSYLRFILVLMNTWDVVEKTV